MSAGGRGKRVLLGIAEAAEIFFLSGRPFSRMLVSDAKEGPQTRGGRFRGHFSGSGVVPGSSTVARSRPDQCGRLVGLIAGNDKFATE